MTQSSENTGRVVASILLPFGVQDFAAIVDLLVAEHGETLRMRYENEFAVFFLPEAYDELSLRPGARLTVDGASGELRPGDQALVV